MKLQYHGEIDDTHYFKTEYSVRKQMDRNATIIGVVLLVVGIVLAIGWALATGNTLM